MRIGPLRGVLERAADRASRALGTRVITTAVGDGTWHRDRVVETAAVEAGELGVRVVGLLKFRPADDKVVLRCESPTGEPLVFKYVNRQAGRGVAAVHGSTLRLAASSDAGLFPACTHIGAHASLEEFVDGKPLKRFARDEWSAVDLPDLFSRLRTFSRTPVRTTTPIRGPELQLILEKYLDRSLKFLRYLPPGQRLRTARSLHRARSELALPMTAFVARAAGAALRPCSAIDDLNDANLVYSRSRARPLIIDVEDVKPGVLGFDCVWLLTTMARGSCPTDELVAAYRMVSSADWLTGQREADLSRLLFHVLLSADSIIIPKRSPSTAALLAVVEGDLRRDGLLGAGTGGRQHARLRRRSARG